MNVRIRGLGFLLGMLLTGAASGGWAQTAAVRGFVTDASDGQAMQGVNVVLEADGGFVAGTATDKDGFFVLSRVPAGTYTLRATFIGFEPFEVALALAQGEVRALNFALTPGETKLDEVVVETEREGGAARVTAGQQIIRPRDIDRIPTPDVSGDLAAYLTTLPGIVSLGDRGGQLFVRGGEPWHNLVLLDGIQVYQPFHILGFFSAFPSDVLSQVDVYAGGFGGRFGGRLSSVIDVATRNGNKRRFEGVVSLAPFVSGVRIEGPLRKDRISVMLSARHSVVREAGSRLVARPLPFRFGDFFGKLHVIVNRNNQLSVSALRSFDSGLVGASISGRPDEEIRWDNEAYGVRYLILPDRLPILAEFLVNGARLTSKLGAGEGPERRSEIGHFGGEGHVTYFAGASEFHWGVFARTTKLDSRLNGLFQSLALDTRFETEVGVYFEPDLALAPGVRVRPGVRVHAFPSKRRTFLEPRVRIVWTRGAHEVSGAFGVYHQGIVGLNDRRDAASVFTAWTAAPFGEVPRAIHVLLGYRVQPMPWVEVSVEGFFKDLKHLSVPEWTPFPRFTTRLQPAEGTARGVDLRVEFRWPHFYGFVTYGLSRVEYEAQQRSLLLWFGTETLKYRPPHDRRHQVNVLASTRVGGFEVSARWQFGSGLPFNRAFGFDGFVLLDGPVNVFEEPGRRRVIFDRPFKGVLPTYHRLDVSVARTFELPSARLTLQAGAINVYDRRNLFYLDVFTLQRVDQLPFLPSFGVKMAFE